MDLVLERWILRCFWEIHMELSNKSGGQEWPLGFIRVKVIDDVGLEEVVWTLGLQKSEDRIPGNHST